MLLHERVSARAQKSRRELTSVAIDCFARYGFQGTSVDRIASIAGVTKGAIYYHFRDKDDLLSAAVMDRIAEFEARVETGCSGLSAADALRRIAKVCIEHAEDGDHSRFVISIMVESIDTNAEISGQLRDMMRRFRAFVKSVVRRGQQSGNFRSDADAAEIAANYVSSVLGAEIQFYQDPESVDLTAALMPAVERILSDLQAGQGVHRP